MTEKSEQTVFDFDEWVELAKNDPDAFEQKRQDAIGLLLENAPAKSKRRMQGLQWQIDQVRITSSTPMSSCIKISQMMWESAVGESGLVDNIEQLRQNKPAQTPAAKADIIDLSQKRENNTD